jgi:hypothetical protein
VYSLQINCVSCIYSQQYFKKKRQELGAFNPTKMKSWKKGENAAAISRSEVMDTFISATTLLSSQVLMSCATPTAAHKTLQKPEDLAVQM